MTSAIKSVQLCLVALLLAAAACPQNPAPAENPTIPTVTFDCLWEAASPQEYTITLRSTGSARYVSTNPVRTSTDRDVDPDYNTEFTLSSAGSARIFALAAQAKYFDGDFDYKKHVVADTGRKTLTFADPTRHYQTVYNASDNPAIDQITRYFQGVSSTVEHGRKLEFLHRYDKLGLEAQLKGMEDELQNHYLAEVQIITPVLESIAGDSSVMNIARQRARRLLQQAKAEMTTNGVKKSQ
jgi:hypothetical protein